MTSNYTLSIFTRLFLVSDRIWGQVMFHMNWYKIVNCKSQTKLRFLILIFVNIEIFTPWAMAAFGGAPNGKRVTSGTIKKLNPKLSIRHYGYKTQMAQN